MLKFRIHTALAGSVFLLAAAGANVAPALAQDSNTYKYCHNASDIEAVANSRRAEDLLDAADFDVEQADMAERRAELAQSMADGARRSAASDRAAAKVMSNTDYWNEGAHYWDGRAADYDTGAERLRAEAARLRQQVEARRAEAAALRQAFNDHCKRTNNAFLQDSGELYELRQAIQRDIKFIDRSNARRRAREDSVPVETSSVIDETDSPQLAILVPARRIDHVHVNVAPRRHARRRTITHRNHLRLPRKVEHALARTNLRKTKLHPRHNWKKPRGSKISKHASLHRGHKLQRTVKQGRLVKRNRVRMTRHIAAPRHSLGRKIGRRMGLGRKMTMHRRLGRLR